MQQGNKGQSNLTMFSWTFFLRIAQFHAIIVFISIIGAFLVQRHYFKQTLTTVFTNHLKEEIVTELKVHQSSPFELCRKTKASEKFWVLVDLKKNILCKSPGLNVSALKLNLVSMEMVFKLEYVTLNHTGRVENYFLALKRLGDNQILIRGQKAAILSESLFNIDKDFWGIFIPLIVILYLLLLWASMQFSKPMRSVVNRVLKINKKLPSSDKDLRVFLDGRQWKDIEKTLKLTEKSLEKQYKSLEQESKKNKILLESITDGICAFAEDESVLFHNSRFSRKFLLHHDGSDKLSLESVFGTEVEILKAYRQCLKTGENLRVKEFKYLHKNRILYFDIIINPILDEANNITYGAVGVFHNVTEAKLTEQMRVDFVANVSHEIRTPLTAIKGFSQVLKSEAKEDERLEEFAGKIITNSERLHTLFSDLLKLSLIESKHKLKKVEVKLKPMLDSAKSTLLQNYKHKKVTINYDLPVESVRVDPALFEQALTNLLDNACKYAGEEPNINVSSEIKNGHVRIKVSDNGPGISDEHVNRIFERFYRVQSNQENDPRLTAGVGLGLSIVKHVINKHKGKVWAENQKSGGTVFVIEIPEFVVRDTVDFT